MIRTIDERDEKIKIIQDVLCDLSEWFGIEESRDEYIKKSSLMPFFAVFLENKAVGFISIKKTSDYTAEIYCMGVKKNFHRNGYGKKLVLAASKYAKRNNYLFMQVKTVQRGKYDIYDRTNDFYKSLGFYELEVFPSLWDQHNPCQVYVKSI